MRREKLRRRFEMKDKGFFSFGFAVDTFAIIPLTFLREHTIIGTEHISPPFISSSQNVHSLFMDKMQEICYNK